MSLSLRKFGSYAKARTEYLIQDSFTFKLQSLRRKTLRRLDLQPTCGALSHFQPLAQLKA